MTHTCMKLKPTPYLFVLFVLFDIIYITISEGQTKGQLVGRTEWQTPLKGLRSEANADKNNE